MSSTLALLISEVLPDIKFLIIEKLNAPGSESTGAFNNAGTGHAANCELNYTPLDEKGNLKIDKALSINRSFETSMSLWASLYEAGKIDIKKFLKFIPHISFVSGQDNISFLKKRFQKMTENPEFIDMEFSTSFDEISSWAPLITKDRNPSAEIAATRIGRGTDINFEALTKEYLSLVSLNKNVEIRYKTELVDLNKIDKKQWELEISSEGRKTSIRTGYVFLGAGGKTISYLQKSKIPEAKSYGGFPVSGKWLICEKKDLTEKHNSKVYGKADIGSPPMSVPHLDTRWIDNKKLLLYGPFAGFTTKFLKQSSYFDLFSSIKKNNIFSMLDVGFKNNDLINYLILQSLNNHNSRVENLKNMMPSANPSDWYLKNAGQRVQIIKKTEGGGSLKFGTEIVNSSDGSLSALLGASPGASTAVSIMVEVLKKSVLFLSDKHNLQKKINDLIYPELSVSKNYSTFIKEIKKRNNSIFGFHP
ncbi:Malate:quinone oxidoreductase [Prochlorococcus sp. MIT 0604]|nr:Malate:quinone oxidoreductase [Prochlorococcus sp. MIT 0604]